MLQSYLMQITTTKENAWHVAQTRHGDEMLQRMPLLQRSCEQARRALARQFLADDLEIVVVLNSPAPGAPHRWRERLYFHDKMRRCARRHNRFLK